MTCDHQASYASKNITGNCGPLPHKYYKPINKLIYYMACREQFSDSNQTPRSCTPFSIVPHHSLTRLWLGNDTLDPATNSCTATPKLGHPRGHKPKGLVTEGPGHGAAHVHSPRDSMRGVRSLACVDVRRREPRHCWLAACTRCGKAACTGARTR